MEKEKVIIYGNLLFKRGTKKALEAMEEILALGEPAYETDTKKLKIGNGELTYINLPYLGDNEWCEEQISELTTRVEGAEETINAFLREAEAGAEAVDTLKEIQASLDAGEVSAANLLNKINDLEAVHKTYVEEHKQIREDLVNIAEDAETEFAFVQEKITQETTAREAQDKLLFDSATQEHEAIRNEINSGLLGAQTARIAIKNELIEKDNAQTAALNAEIARAQAAENTALSEAKAYTDKVKTNILGEGISETFDTLVEIQDWINGDGVNATELASAIANEATNRQAQDTILSDRLDAFIAQHKTDLDTINDEFEKAYDQQTEAFNNYISEIRAELEEDDRNNLAEAKSYTDSAKSALFGEGSANFDTIVKLSAKTQELINTRPTYVAEQIAISETNIKAYLDQKIGEIENGAY